MNRRIQRELAWVVAVTDRGCNLKTKNFEPSDRNSVFLNFILDGQSFFLSAPFDRRVGSDLLSIRMPSAIYRAERRSRQRHNDPTRTNVFVEVNDGATVKGVLVDRSPEGMSMDVTETDARELGSGRRLRLRDADQIVHAEIRHQRPAPGRNGWIRIGLDLSATPRAAHLHIEERSQVLPITALDRASRRFQILKGSARVLTSRLLQSIRRGADAPAVRVIDYKNELGEGIRALVDSWGEPLGATAVVIPPAWGRTKETLMPLAATIVAGFRAAGEPIVVLRFDGIRKRGESYRDPDCRKPGTEHRRFTFSQGVRDIRATLDFLERSPEFRPRRIVLVSFSAASIESRRAVASDRRIDGWVSVVGASDTQSMMRVISGGVDYVGGVDRGVKFGEQEVLGVNVDIDFAGEDLLRHQLPFLEDSRRDFAMIRVPVSWIHGRYDAWMDPTRVRDVMSRGETSNRRFISVPTGHMLRTSGEALDVFQLVCGEVARIALGREIESTLPDLSELDAKRQAEQTRLPGSEETDLRRFWRDYLLGRDDTVGIELMTNTVAYRALMQRQIEALKLGPSVLVADVGCGTGALPLHMRKTCHAQLLAGIRVVEMDFVQDGLRRARLRLGECPTGSAPKTLYVSADLDVAVGGFRFPLSSESVDALLASLFLNYVREPAEVLREMWRVLKPGGSIAVSTLRRDADFSKLFVEGLAELREKGVGEALVLSAGGTTLDEAARSYLNDAARLLDLEESGRFRFWDKRELQALLQGAGFANVEIEMALGNPPQALVASGKKR
jgi:ubiquinone/menaquinone biosynthesis C-methylase UbiE